MEPPRRFAPCGCREVAGFLVPVATGFVARRLGLALLRRERAGPGLLLPGCGSVHTFGMRFPLDVVFLDDAERVVRVARAVPSCRVLAARGAAAVLELPAGAWPRRRPGGGSAIGRDERRHRGHGRPV
jgi:uncharacterized membrane protein (UPF0127 family)